MDSSESMEVSEELISYEEEEEELEEKSGWTSYLDADSTVKYSRSLSTGVVGNSEDMTMYMKDGRFLEEESYGSTLSDASSGHLHQNNRNPIKKRNPSKWKGRLKLEQLNLHTYTQEQMQLEDTATSSPSLSVQHEDSASSCSPSVAAQHGDIEGSSEDVSRRFRVLEALIPRLKEVTGPANEEEMLNVIINHVQALEFKVEVLSNVWQISRKKHP